MQWKNQTKISIRTPTFSSLGKKNTTNNKNIPIITKTTPATVEKQQVNHNSATKDRCKLHLCCGWRRKRVSSSKSTDKTKR